MKDFWLHSDTTIFNFIGANVIVLKEHHITGKNKVEVNGYKTFSRNRLGKEDGGVSISVDKDNEDLDDCIRSKIGEDEDEFIVVRNERFSPALNIMTVYGEQEFRTRKCDMEHR